MFALSTGSVQHPLILEDTLAALNGDEVLLKTLVHMVLHQIAEEMPVIRSSVALRNTNSLKAASHRLKGVLGAIAATPAYEACTALNRAARIGVVESYAPSLAVLEVEIDRLFPCLSIWLATQDKV